MRVAAALVAVLVVAGCNNYSKPAEPGAAALVPADARTFVHANDLGPVRDLVGPFPDDLDVAVLRTGDVVAFAKTRQKAKLKDGYTVERVGEWFVGADSSGAFAAVRRAASGNGLADVAEFSRGFELLDNDARAQLYATGSLGTFTAQVTGNNDAAQVDVNTNRLQPPFQQRLLHDVPSGALLALSFRNGEDLVRQLAYQAGEYQGLLLTLAPALRGDGVLYVTQGLLLPTFVLELEGPDPAGAARWLRRVATHVGGESGGLVKPRVFERGGRVFLTTGEDAPPTGGRSLLDDQAFKDARESADVPDDVAWLVYADIPRLLPVAQTLSQLLGGTALSPAVTRRLERLGTLIAYGADARARIWASRR